MRVTSHTNNTLSVALDAIKDTGWASYCITIPATVNSFKTIEEKKSILGKVDMSSGPAEKLELGRWYVLLPVSERPVAGKEDVQKCTKNALKKQEEVATAQTIIAFFFEEGSVRSFTRAADIWSSYEDFIKLLTESLVQVKPQ